MIRTGPTRKARDSTTALINIVFLMLIFFLVAGTIAQPLDGALKLVRTADLDSSAPPDALVVAADGAMTYRGDPVADAARYVALRGDDAPQVVRLVPDRDLPAAQLVRIGADLRRAGAQRVVIVTERGLE